MLSRVESPVIMETHGGFGRLYRACYDSIAHGVVFEKKPERAQLLALQRPTWAVYQADCVMAVAGGAGAHLPVNVLDCDPYGDPWPVISVFFDSDRPRPDVVFVVVNDGLRQKVRMGGAWGTKTLSDAVSRFGNDLHDYYLDVCKVLLAEKAARAGYSLSRFVGYYCGHAQQMTHYLAVLNREA